MNAFTEYYYGGDLTVKIYQPWNGQPLTDDEMRELYQDNGKPCSYIQRFVARGVTENAHFKKGDFVYGSHSIRRPGIVTDILLRETWAIGSLIGPSKPCGHNICYVVRWLDRKGKVNVIEIERYGLSCFTSAIKIVEKQLKAHRNNLRDLKKLAEIIDVA